MNPDLTQEAAAINLMVGKWAVLEWKPGEVSPPRGGVYGTHLATFLFCPFGEEIQGLNYCWLYNDHDSRVYRVGEALEGIRATWVFIFNTLIKFKIREMSDTEMSFLDLPDQGSLIKKPNTDEVNYLRSLPELNAFRQPGHPDDVCAICRPDYLETDRLPLIGEGVWVRLTSGLGGNKFKGILLNEPQNSILQRGQEITVKLDRDYLGGALVCCEAGP